MAQGALARLAGDAEVAAGAGVLALAALASARASGSAAVAVYALSFWHYLLYWWAYRHGAVSAQRLRRDAGVTKTIALLAFAYAWATVPSTWPAVAAIGAGFALNGLAAWQLGADRTYYGWELGDVTYRRVESFPYSVLPHPMLVGNVLAFAGALAAPSFRAAWWPLSALHVGLNVGLLIMETRVSPASEAFARLARPPVATGGARIGRHVLAAAGGAVIGVVAAAAAAGRSGGVRGSWSAAALGAAAALQLSLIVAAYVQPPTRERVAL